jgi:hypothetical protein
VVRAGANTIESEVLHPPGTPLNPVTLSTVIAKFRGCATPPLAAAEAQDLLEVLLALPEANSADISRRLQPAAVTAAA